MPVATSTILAGIGAAGALASGVGSLVGGSKASSAAGSAADAQTLMAQQQAAMAQQQWNRYLQAFAPLEDTMIREAQTPARQAGEFANMAAGISQRYGDAAGNMRRMMGGAYPSGSGPSGATIRSLEQNRIQDLYKAEAGWNNNKWNRMAQVAGIGRSLPATATAGYQGAANTYGNLANMYGNLSGQAYGGVGQGIGNLYQMYALSQNKGTWDPTLGSYVSGGSQYFSH